MNRKQFLSSFDFQGYVVSKFPMILETSNEDRVRVTCPMCSDTSGHLYILLSAGLAYCQKCKYDPKSPIRFISDVEGISMRDVINMADGYVSYLDVSVDDVVDELFEEEESQSFDYEIMVFDETFVPVGVESSSKIINNLVRKARTYLEDRGVTQQQMLDYDMRYCYDGDYSGRVVVPCYYEGNLVTFVARDIIGYSSRKYLNPTGNKQSDFLFNFNPQITDTVVVTEGVFDAISASRVLPAVATFGKSLSSRQIELLNKIKTVIFYWDADAYPQVEKYVDKIQSSCRVVCHNDGKDAGSRTFLENKALIESAVSLGSVDYEMFKLMKLKG